MVLQVHRNITLKNFELNLYQLSLLNPLDLTAS